MADREQLVEGGVDALGVIGVGGHGAGRVVAVAQHGGGGRPRHRARSLGDQPQRPLHVGGRLQRVGQRGGRLEPLPPTFAEAVGASVVDDEARSAGQRPHEELVVLGELAAAGLLGQVEVAEHGAADPDRDPEEGGHRRVVRREPHRVRMRAEHGQPDRLRLLDEQAQDPLAAREVADQRPLLVVEAGGDELDQEVAAADHAQRGVLRAGELARRLDDAGEDAALVEVGGDRDDRVEQRLGGARQLGTRVRGHPASVGHGRAVRAPDALTGPARGRRPPARSRRRSGVR